MADDAFKKMREASIANAAAEVAAYNNTYNEITKNKDVKSAAKLYLAAENAAADFDKALLEAYRGGRFTENKIQTGYTKPEPHLLRLPFEQGEKEIEKNFRYLVLDEETALKRKELQTGAFMASKAYKNIVVTTGKNLGFTNLSHILGARLQYIDYLKKPDTNNPANTEDLGNLPPPALPTAPPASAQGKKLP